MAKPTRQPLDRVFFALSDPTRRSIVMRLAQGEATMTDLSKPFSISLPGLTKHLQILADADLIERRKRGRSQHCRLNPVAMRDAAEWLDRYRVFWERQLDSLERYLKTMPTEDAN
ncbi:MAG TPA: metalloregulator ArsR/SmtB family transcription factor [Chthonomonadaceae bacterium]|nr:metalloregulator ArsR/SmtB family transcription factor [Chthonomonadaceae bacterium]